MALGVLAACGRVGFEPLGEGDGGSSGGCESVVALDIDQPQNQQSGSLAGRGNDHVPPDDCGPYVTTNIEMFYRFDVTAPAGLNLRIRVASSEMTGWWFTGPGCPVSDVYACAEIRPNATAIDHFYDAGPTFLWIERTSAAGDAFEIFVDQL
jgi:hypothetical protein